jgi:indolepyruvate ferredoxin oxidoreductase alpha subunit
MKKLLMGNEAIALGAINAGVKVVCGYPGTPSTEVLESVAKNNDGRIYVEWSVNEKAAMEVGAGAAYSGARVMVTMKQVGLNVASDPLMSLSYIGVKGGMVVLVADDPGPLSSQTEQDTRHFAKYANLPVLDPSTPEEAYEMVQYAFELSEKIKLPVFLRPTTRVCHACSTIDVKDEPYKYEISGFVKDPKWVIFPALAYKNHIVLERMQKEIAAIFDDCKFNSIHISNSRLGNGKIGFAASGICYAYLSDVVKKYQLDCKIFKVGTPYPFPEKKAVEFLENLEKVMVLEELDPVVEEALCAVAAKNAVKVKIMGKKTGSTPLCGEFSYEIAQSIVLDFCGISAANKTSQATNDLPGRPPVLCAGCPHRASFYAVKQAARGEKAVFTGDIGCYTLGNAKPLDMVDTCLCMGASITVAQGIKRIEPETKLFAFIGDSTFFHTGLAGVINALYNQTDITVIILDNGTTAMTGHQPHPGIGKTMMNGVSDKISIYDTLKGIGVPFVRRVNPFDQKKAIETVKEASEQKSVSAVIFESPCIAMFKKTKEYSVEPEKCKACGKCVREIGCPAMVVLDNKKVQIDSSLCYGCGFCTDLCKFGAIGSVEI